MTPQYNVTVHKDRGTSFSSKVGAVEASIGDYFQGKAYSPDLDELSSVLWKEDRKIYKAIMRSLKADAARGNNYSGRVVSLVTLFHTLKGKRLGSLYITPDWDAMSGNPIP